MTSKAFDNVIALNNAVNVLSFGADRTGATASHAAFQAAVDAASGPPANGFTHVIVPAGNYRFDAKVTIPDGRRMKWQGLGDARLFTNSNIVMIEHIRGSSANWSRLFLENLWLQKLGGAGSAIGINWQGPDSTYDDSRLEMTHCEMRGFWRGVSMGYASGAFSQAYHVDNLTDFFFTRGASFINLENITSLNGDYFVYADDTVGGGISNTLNVLQCVSVFKQQTDIRMRGWDAVNVQNGGCDLGGSGSGAGQSAIYLQSCTNVNIANQYVSSATTGSPNPRDNRSGINLLNSQVTHIIGNRIVDNAHGVLVTGPSGGANTLIQGNSFRNNQLNHIIAVDSAGGRVLGNSFDNTPNRTSTNFEVYLNVAGNTGWSVSNNLFEGASYSIVTGGNDNVGNNIWSEPLP